MPEFEVPIAGGFYESKSRPLAHQECLNLLPIISENPSLTREQLLSPSGIEEYATTNAFAVRGSHVMDSIAYTVQGEALYRVNADGTSDNLGAIQGTERVSMADNGVQLCIIVPGVDGYIFTEPSTLTKITDSDFTANGLSLQVAYKDGYFIHISKDYIFLSDLNNGLAYNALAFGTAEVDPDENTALIVYRNRLFVGGNETIEEFANIGGEKPFPFQRIGGSVITKGIKAKLSLVQFDKTFVFLGGGVNERPAIWRSTGGDPVKISSSAIDAVIQDYSDDDLKTVYATTIAENGRYIVNFHFIDKVFSYDGTASTLKGKPVWHQRSSLNSDGNSVLWRVGSIFTAYGEILVADTIDGRIGKLNDEINTEYGIKIISRFSLIPLVDLGNTINLSEIELLCESGVGNITEPGSEPQVTMDYTDDGFKWSNALDRSLGKQGEYDLRQIWRRQGQARRYRVYRFSIASEVRKSIMGLWIRYA